MTTKFTLFLAGSLCLGMLASGCANPSENAKQKFVKRNPKIAERATELYEVSVDHWVRLEWGDGLGHIMRSAAHWKKPAMQTTDKGLEMQQSMAELFDAAAYRYVNALIRMHEIRGRMRDRDKLFYCRNRDELYGRLYIVDDGRIRESFQSAFPWEDVENEALWKSIVLPKTDK